jgi:serine/threonine protein kinase
VIRPAQVEDRRTLRGLAAEVEMLKRLNHPVLLRGFGADLEGPRPHVVTEHLEGPRLSSLVRRYGPLPADQLVPLGLQLSAAAHYMAEEEVVHLDIKPSNIIMGAPARLIDLSVALTFEEAEDLRSLVGTDAYMAPEQTRVDRSVPVGPPADVWGIGVTLYRAATGHKAFGDPVEDSLEPIERWPQLAHEPEPMEARIPPALEDLILEMLRPDPAERPTASEVHSRLEPVLNALPKPRISKLKPRVMGASR